MSLLKNLDDLVNTAPALVDPEDDIHEDTKARLVDRCVADYDDAAAHRPKSRRQPQVILGDRYAGKKVSRKDLDEDGFDTYEEDSHASGDADSISDFGSDVSKDQQGEQDDDDGDEASSAGVSDDQDQVSKEEEADEDEGDEEDDDDGDIDTEDVDLGASVTFNQKSSDMDGVDKFSSFNMAAEVKKGKAVRAQLLIWDSILELRIQLQKLLVLANQFPKPEKFSAFRLAALEQDKKNAKLMGQAKHSVELVMNQLLNLQEKLRDSYPDIRNIFSSAGGQQNGVNPVDSEDEEIPSDTEPEESDDKGSEGATVAGSTKRKSAEQMHPKRLVKCRKMDVCASSVAEFWKSFEPYRNSTIEKWYERTRLLSGKVGRGFASLEQSPVKQIQHILMDEERLLRRTQTKRSSYRILGDEETTNDEEQNPGTADVDEEIFDDDDFYHHLLREIIERKTSNVDNPVALSRQWLEIQKLRKKVKRKVDTRASKGRKIRYDIIPKLVNYMAPLDRSTYSDEAKTELFGSLFGQKKYSG
uniref:Uncharacterized protein n=1 Tax=Amblyomma maculatum TaxID=34609 RepID=G3MKK6_AMBMU